MKDAWCSSEGLLSFQYIEDSAFGHVPERHQGTGEGDRERSVITGVLQPLPLPFERSNLNNCNQVQCYGCQWNLVNVVEYSPSIGKRKTYRERGQRDQRSFEVHITGQYILPDKYRRTKRNNVCCSQQGQPNGKVAHEFHSRGTDKVSWEHPRMHSS